MQRIIRAAGALLGAAIAYQVAESLIGEPVIAGFSRLNLVIGSAAVGFVAGYAVAVWVWVWFVRAMEWLLARVLRLPLRDTGAGLIGLVAALVVANLLTLPLRSLPLLGPYLPAVAGLALGYMGVRIALRYRDEVVGVISRARAQSHDDAARTIPKVLDTSVIIDGRIADVAATGFIEGPLVVARSVLGELQRIADSTDTLRRNRGRRGLDVLNRMQKDLQNLQIYDDSAEPASDVDGGLVRLAKRLRGWLVTNDFNLNKVAGLEGVRVLNLNELANGLKPIVLPGEELAVHVIKDGKEPGQGIAYLEDGTMIVVEGGRKYMNETFDVVVTSVLQTVAGRMIFARPKADVEAGHVGRR